MDNLTRRLRIAFASPDIHPIPGHHLVVFKKLGAGQALRAVLAPGERLKLKLLERPESLLAYAVSNDPHLRHRFSRAYEHVDYGHSYILHFIASFSVKDPRLVVEQLERDPLRKLEEETVRLFGGAIRHLPWSAIEREDDELERGAQSRSRADFAGIVRSNLENLQAITASVGLALDDVAISRTLPDAPTSVRRREIEVEQEERRHRAEHELAMNDTDRDGELARRRQAIGNRLRLHDSFAETVAKMIERMGGEIRSIPELQEVLPRLDVILEETRRLAIGELGAATRAAAGALPGAAPALPGATPGLTELIGGVLALRDGRDADRLARRRLCAAALHLVAELSRGEEGSEERLAEMSTSVAESFRLLLPALSDREVQLLHRLQDLDSMRVHLA